MSLGRTVPPPPSSPAAVRAVLRIGRSRAPAEAEWSVGASPPQPGMEGGPMSGLDAALGGAMDQATDQGAGAGAPDMGIPPDAGAEAPMMDDPGAGGSEPDMPPPPPDDPIV